MRIDEKRIGCILAERVPQMFKEFVRETSGSKRAAFLELTLSGTNLDGTPVLVKADPLMIDLNSPEFQTPTVILGKREGQRDARTDIFEKILVEEALRRCMITVREGEVVYRDDKYALRLTDELDCSAELIKLVVETMPIPETVEA